MTDTAVNYGNSLYELSAEENLADEMLNDVEAVADILINNPDYIRLLSEPSVSMKERTGLIDQAFRGSIRPYLLNFLKILCENGSMKEYPGCARQFRIRYNRDHNIAEAEVTSAVQLTEDQCRALKDKLETMTGKSIVLRQRTDEKFIAGIRVEVDGKQYDGTAAGRLDSMRKKVNEIIL